jgi:hypothetical protein
MTGGTGHSAASIDRLPEKVPKLFDVVPLPETERGRECTLWTGDGPSPCGNEATYVFVYEKSLDPDDDSRDNSICCEECKPRSLHTDTDQEVER